MLLVAKSAACPPDAVAPRRASDASFYRFWAASAAAAAAAHPECGSSSAACRAQPACYLPLLERQLFGYASGQEAAAAAAGAPGTADAVLDFAAWQQALDVRREQQQDTRQGLAVWGAARSSMQGPPPPAFAYTLRMNHSHGAAHPHAPEPGAWDSCVLRAMRRVGRVQLTGVPLLSHQAPPPTHTHTTTTTTTTTPQFDLLPGNQWKQYWFFANLQALVEQAALSPGCGRRRRQQQWRRQQRRWQQAAVAAAPPPLAALAGWLRRPRRHRRCCRCS